MNTYYVSSGIRGSARAGVTGTDDNVESTIENPEIMDGESSQYWYLVFVPGIWYILSGIPSQSSTLNKTFLLQM